MSLILEGIDLPKGETAEVIIRIQPNGDIKDGHGILLTETKATQISTPHGRLIDGGKLDKLVHEWSPVYTYGRSAFTRAIENAPTILKAEGEW